MAFTTPSTVAVGDVATAALWNEQVRDNMSAVLPYGETWQTYTPTLTAASSNPTLGTGSSATGHFYRVGKLCTAMFRIKAGTAGFAAGSGLYRISMPLTAASFQYTTNFYRVGVCNFFDVSVPLDYTGLLYFVGTGAVEISIHGRGTAQTDADPVVPANLDEWTGSCTYALA